MKANPSLNRLSFSPRNRPLNDKDAIKHRLCTPFRNVAPVLSDARHPSWNSFQMKAFIRALCETAVFNLSWCPITGHAIREYSHFRALIGNCSNCCISGITISPRNIEKVTFFSVH
ncbi:hypothetical protein CEXT_740251 [Caerostris extrusa]|uniref:Uncharacterized protein n=1 Tax=Caerostris extrusa TaxID=172846 RepID=A0AAV4RHM3_CAEEX|nr:hypothetical protein CEXT_740251 [Caerostris extrusa]